MGDHKGDSKDETAAPFVVTLTEDSKGEPNLCALRDADVKYRPGELVYVFVLDDGVDCQLRCMPSRCMTDCQVRRLTEWRNYGAYPADDTPLFQYVMHIARQGNPINGMEAIVRGIYDNYVRIDVRHPSIELAYEPTYAFA
jgi:hypothetical protein